MCIFRGHRASAIMRLCFSREAMGMAGRVGVIGGSGARFASGLSLGEGAVVTTPWGDTSGPLREGSIDGRPVFWLARHGEHHTLAPHRVNYRANIHALRAHGVCHVIALNTVGGIASEALSGTLWLPDQIIDYTTGRESSFHDGSLLPLQHQEFAEPYDADLRGVLARAAAEAGIPVVFGGTYGCTQGPRLETAAEIRRMRRDGCDLVGMTGMPEAALAREAGLAYASLSMVVNPAAGMSDEPITMEAILREAEGCMAKSLVLITRALAMLDQVRG